MTIQYAVFIRCTGENSADHTAVVHQDATSALEACKMVATVLGPGWKPVGALARNAKQEKE